MSLKYPNQLNAHQKKYFELELFFLFKPSFVLPNQKYRKRSILQVLIKRL